MSAEKLLNELTAGLRETEVFLGIFEDFARNSAFDKHLDYVNGILSMLAMSSAKMDDIIEIAEKLEDVLK